MRHTSPIAFELTTRHALKTSSYRSLDAAAAANCLLLTHFLERLCMCSLDAFRFGTVRCTAQNRDIEMESVLVSTLVGSAAGLNLPNSLCYWEAEDLLLIGEGGSNGVQLMIPTTDKRKSAVKLALTSVLLEGGVLPLQPLISIIFLIS